jgi:hypothetical protein
MGDLRMHIRDGSVVQWLCGLVASSASRGDLVGEVSVL